ncbi:MAG: hypothetical protein DRJ42_14105 [Deltaproteobacteria bacterium]|nr:MAG: hypothetical protein DRJ42_14105 [Deltaproteobacteria bacterium]
MRAFALDERGNLFIAGGFATSIDFGGGLRSGSANFVASFDPTGAYRWDTTTTAYATSMAAQGGRVFLGGAFSGSVDFGGGVRSSPTTQGGFLVTLSD